ncbi:MAG: putative penicillin-binding protein PbpX [Luteibacter sp.]|nr:MAG: putative penicillin-binding protein PbpX [Luteibacter sp.]
MRVFTIRCKAIVLSFVIVLVVACSGVPTRVQSDDDLSHRLQALLQSNRHRYGVAGQALLVMHDGKLLFRGVDGDATIDPRKTVSTDSIFPAFSISKLFVSTLILQLVDQGNVDFDRPASDYLPGLPKTWKTITVRDFLDHTSGVPEYFATREGDMSSDTAFPPDLTAVFASLSDTPLQFTPGTQTRYTQTNYLVLSALLATHYGKPYPQVAQEHIIRPLALRHTWLGPAGVPTDTEVTAYTANHGTLRPDKSIAWPSYAYGHAELYTTMDDLARFMQAVASGQFAGKDTLVRLWQPRELSTGERGWFASGWDYGENHGYREVGHDGGARSRVRMLFKDSLDSDTYLIVYLTNGSAKDVWSRTLVESVEGVVLSTAACRAFSSGEATDPIGRWAGAPASLTRDRTCP